MARDTSIENASRLVLGLVVLAVGVLFLLDTLDIFETGTLWEWWPVILIAAGISKLAQPAARGRGFGIFLVVLGAIFLLHNFDLIEASPLEFWPLILVGLGASMLWHAMFRPRPSCCEPAPPPLTFDSPGGDGGGTAPPVVPPVVPPVPDHDPTINAVAILGGYERRITAQDFRGGSATAIMGGCELDFSGASIVSGPAVLDVFAFWGGVEVRVPRDWTVAMRGTPILGGFTDKTAPVPRDPRKVLIIRGLAIMGGAEVKS